MNFSLWLKTAVSFLVENLRTTFILGFLISFAIGTLVFIISLANGISDIMIINSTGMYSGQISGSDLPSRIRPAELKKPFVKAVLQRFQIPGTVIHQDKKRPLDIVAIYPDQEKAHSFFYKKVIAGRFLLKGKKEILLNLETAERIGSRPGDTIIGQIGDHQYKLKVAGIFQTGVDSLDRALAFCPVFESLILPETWQAAIFIKRGTDLSSAMSDFSRSGFKVDRFKPWTQLMPDLTQLLELNDVCVNILVFIVLGVVSLGCAGSFAIFVVSRIKEYGVLRAMGVTGLETGILIYLQVVLMNVIASAVGVLAGMLAVWSFGRSGIDLSVWTSHNRYFAATALIFPRLSIGAVSIPPAVSLGFCFIAAAWPIWLVVSQKTCDIISRG
ncbi:FtsX-like permease family protein [uncultured Desulfobacter sp.]|uniref:ABC transporter permease n=1 Tax=uncultured Desulfobacter sp. TaxID=240139 RepID=UPI0029F4F5D9|nr:FtsX-like permease family protein [uncultured Desulfobacter sp.]